MNPVQTKEFKHFNLTIDDRVTIVQHDEITTPISGVVKNFWNDGETNNDYSIYVQFDNPGDSGIEEEGVWVNEDQIIKRTVLNRKHRRFSKVSELDKRKWSDTVATIRKKAEESKKEQESKEEDVKVQDQTSNLEYLNRTLDKFRNLIINKSEQYGWHYLNDPFVAPYKSCSPLAAIENRIAEKLSRAYNMAVSNNDDNEDTIADLVGCYILREMILMKQKDEGNS